jgi:hypothetical protein
VKPCVDAWSNITAPLPTSSWWIALALDNRSALVRPYCNLRARPSPTCVPATAELTPPPSSPSCLRHQLTACSRHARQLRSWLAAPAGDAAMPPPRRWPRTPTCCARAPAAWASRRPC